jgi:ABC-type nitrate/sulfonate/bicarbonate transport system substrate-binding protein
MKEHPEWIQAFVDALISGWTFTYENQTDAVADISSLDAKNLTPELVRFNLIRQKPYVRPEGARYCDISADRMQATQQVLIEQKIMTKPVDLGQAVTDRFIAEHYRTEATSGK